MWKIACLVLLLALPARAEQDTLGVLGGALPAGGDRAGWLWDFCKNGWCASNHKPNNLLSNRIYGVPQFILNDHPRPYTYSIAVAVRGDDLLMHDKLGALGGIILNVGPAKPWMGVVITHTGQIKVITVDPASNRMNFGFTSGVKVAPQSTAIIKAVENDKNTVVTVNDQYVASIGGAPQGRPAIIMAGAGDFFFRNFEMTSPKGPVIYVPKQRDANAPRVRM